jgi:hypothetical protein
VVLPVQAGAESAKGVFFARMIPLDPRYQMLSQKHLVDASVDTFASENWLATGLNLQNLQLIPPGLLLFALSP